MDPINLAKSFSGVFFSIVFIQSGMDKIFNWKDNLEWLKGYFEKSFLAPFVKLMLLTLTIVETFAGLLCLLGVFCLFFCKDDVYLLGGICLVALSLVMLIFGQRLAKDYEGAKTVAIYFAVALLSLAAFF